MTLLPRILAGVAESGAASLPNHVATYGPLPGLGAHERDDLLASIEDAGLRGRGGAGFPTAVKFHAVMRSGGEPIVIANGAEGEPASAKDRLLLSAIPHLVLDGAVLAAQVVGAVEAIIAVPPEERVVEPVRIAIAERKKAKTDRVKLRLSTVPADTYLAGQETALIRYLMGGPAKPISPLHRPSERGFNRQPTLVQNVETLAQLAMLARHGSGWFRLIGTQEEPGSALVTISGDVSAPGVYEIALGTPAATVVAAAGGDVNRCRAILTGGYFGGWIDANHGASLTISDHDLRRHGSMLGAGVIVVLGSEACPVAETARVVRYLANQSAGQCGPCANGLPAISVAIDRLAGGIPYAGVHDDLKRWCSVVRHRGACRHPDGVAGFVSSALTVFSQEFDDHARNGACSACSAPPVLTLPQPLVTR